MFLLLLVNEGKWAYFLFIFVGAIEWYAEFFATFLLYYALPNVTAVFFRGLFSWLVCR